MTAHPVIELTTWCVALGATTAVSNQQPPTDDGTGTGVDLVACRSEASIIAWEQDREDHQFRSHEAGRNLREARALPARGSRQRMASVESGHRTRELRAGRRARRRDRVRGGQRR